MSEPDNGLCVCFCGRQTQTMAEMIEHYRIEHPDTWMKWLRPMSEYEQTILHE